MTTDYTVRKFYIPTQDSDIGVTVIKIVTTLEDNLSYLGVGDDDWVIKNGFIFDSDSDFITYIKDYKPHG